ncbi:MAG: hypothetical protein OXT67_01035, partial [Zetaproteobacteria bacterium]|nr:hypothetical protein [Zetaproteobacteria bacterium]
MKSTHHEARLTFFWGGLLWLAGSLLACFATFYVLQPKGSLGLQPLSVVPPVQHSREAEIVFDRVVVEPLPTPSLSGSPQHAGHQTVEAAQASPSPVRAPSLDLAQIERLVEQHQVKEALVELKKFVATHPRHAEAQMMLAMLHLLATEGEGAPEAVVALEKVLALDPSHELALVQLVELYEMTGTQKQGLTYLRGLQQQHPQNAVLNHSVGKALLAQGKSAEAVKYLEQAASVD